MKKRKMTIELAQKAGLLCHPRGCVDPEYGFVSTIWIPVSTGMTPPLYSFCSSSIIIKRKVRKEIFLEKLKATSYKLKAGISLVEVVIGTSLILFSLAGLTTAYSFYLKAGLKNANNLKAAFLLQEGVEAAMLLRDDSWNSFASLTAGTPYHLSWNGTKWVATTAEVQIDGIFKRTIQFENVYRREGDKDIVASTSPDTKSLDAGTKKVTVRVFTGSNVAAMFDKSVSTYLTNLFE